MKSFQDFRSEISIIDMARSIGYKQDRSKGEKWPVMVNQYNGEKIIIVNPKSNSNQGYFNPGNDLDKGTLIDFIKNRLGDAFPVDLGLSEAKNINKVLYGFQNIVLPEDNLPFHTPIAKNHESVDFSTNGLSASLVNPAYLISRNISKVVLDSDELKGRVLNIGNKAYPNIAFPFYDIDGKVVGIEKRNHEYKRFVLGSDISNSVWHSNMPEKLDRIVIAESAIDAISYMQLKGQENTLYVSTGGSFSFNQVAVLKGLKAKAKTDNGFSFVSAVDNDKDGHKYDMKFKDWLKPDDVIIDKPVNKDYNEDLSKNIEKKTLARAFKM